MRRINIVTVARSDYGILLPVVEALLSRDDVVADLIVTGMHLDPRFGNTVEAIESDGMPIAARIDTGRMGDDDASIAAAMARQIEGMSRHLSVSRPDILVLMGDRYEMMAAAVAALPFNIAIAHIHGGEASYGAIDDAMRHAITKLSHLHFPATRAYADRIRQMGEADDRITIAGAPGLDNIKTMDLPAPEDVAARFGFPYCADDPPLVLTFHPETRSDLAPETQIEELLQALSEESRSMLFTLPNADQGGVAIAGQLRAFSAARENVSLVDNLGTANYFAMLKESPAMIGNSSSGIIEAASFALPVVDIGDRQRGRDHGPNVIHAALNRDAIRTAIETALDPAFRESLAGMRNPYGDGNAAGRIAERLAAVELSTGFLAKEFADRSFDGRETSL